MRPLSAEEIIDGIAVELEPEARYNRKRKLKDATAIQELCPGLTDITVERRGTFDGTKGQFIPGEFIFIRIAHFSVQEYLESDRIRIQKAARFSVASQDAHVEMARVCMTLLQEPEPTNDGDFMRQFPLSVYAARYWAPHFRQSNEALNIQHQAMSFLQTELRKCISIEEQETMKDEDVGMGLQYASRHGLEKCVRRLVDDNSVDINASAKAFGTALDQSSHKGYIEIVKFLLNHGADVNKQSRRVRYSPQDGRYPLMSASCRGHADIVRLLLEKGAHIDACDQFGNTSLIQAARNGHIGIVRLLLTRGASTSTQRDGPRPQYNAMEAAAEAGNTAIVRLLIEYSPEYGRSLHLAALCGHLPIVKLLLQAGVDVDSLNSCGRTPLSYAAEYGEADVVEVLLKEGNCAVNLADQDEKGRSPFFWAFARGHVEVMKRFFKIVRVDLPGRDDRDFFQRCLDEKMMEPHEGKHVVEWYLKNGLVDNSPTGDDERTLFSRLIKQLAPSRLDWFTYEGLTAFIRAFQPDLDGTDIHGRIPLTWAVEHDNYDLTLILLDNGADVNAVDIMGRSAIQISALHPPGSHEYPWTIEGLLLRRGATLPLRV